MLEFADPVGNKADYTVREMLDEFATTLDGRFDNDPQAEATLRYTVGRAYYHLGTISICACLICDARRDLVGWNGKSRRGCRAYETGRGALTGHPWAEVRKRNRCSDAPLKS